MLKRLGLVLALGLPLGVLLGLHLSQGIELHRCYRCSLCGEFAP